MSIEGSLPESNIPRNSLIVVDKSTDNMSVRVRRFRSGIIALTGFAVAQFLEGAELFAKKVKSVYSEDVQLMLRLSKITPGFQHYQSVQLPVNFRELQMLREWLELRMAHCEKERDERTLSPFGDGTNPKFNPDTYIGQKLLLLDLRELMIGEIIEQHP